MNIDTDSQNSVILQACAKINLTLDVFSKRSDGYHSLASVMQAISIYDTIEISRKIGQGVEFTCEGEHSSTIPTDSSNLVARAAESILAYLEGMRAGDNRKSGVECGLKIHLIKRIPTQAGLGGGSSDAAATLVGIDKLFDMKLDIETLRKLAAYLGSDVPFFLRGGTAVIRGVGDQITQLADSPEFWLVVVKPDENVSTGWAYNQLDAIQDRHSHRATKNYEEAMKQGDSDRIISMQCNDFEEPVFSSFPTLAWVCDELRMAGAITAHLCGSGSALYGVAPDETTAYRFAESMKKRYSNTYVARTLTSAESHPLYQIALQSERKT